MSRKQIDELVKKARENLTIRQRPKVYVNGFARDITNDLLYRVELQIKQGKTPIIVLPDTSMRLAGILFHTALRTAFPEIYAKNPKLLQSVFFLYTPKIHEKPTDIRIPDYLKYAIQNTNNPVVFIVDEPGRTIGFIEQALKSTIPNIKTEPYGVDEAYFNAGSRVDRIAKTIYGEKYVGRNGILKAKYSPSRNTPDRIIAKHKDYYIHNEYTSDNLEHVHYKELSARKEFYRFGIELGLRYRRQMDAIKKMRE